MSTAHIVVDLGFGDAGKGTITDFLCRERGVRWVVRHHGGAQAGHNVVTDDGRHHTFSQFGAGSFMPSVRTYLGPEFLLHPSALLVEAQALLHKGVSSPLERLVLAAPVRITTPFHQSLGRLRELARGGSAHGTCGVGVGETVRDFIASPEAALRVCHLIGDEARLHRRVSQIRERLFQEVGPLLDLCAEVPGAAEEISILEDPAVVDIWLRQIAPFIERLCATPHMVDSGAIAERIVAEGHDMVFEGAQGVLLDEDWGFHPHTTWSPCTDQNAHHWLDKFGFTGVRHRVAVLRSYMTRHGVGPLPSFAPELASSLAEPHNGHEGWQGAFRRGWPDPLLWRYALRANGGADSLALTHLDQVMDGWRAVESYPDLPSEHLLRDGAIRLGEQADLHYRERLTRALLCVSPSFVPVPAPMQEWVSEELSLPVSIQSWGPRPGDKKLV